MGNLIAKLAPDCYVEWSTITDSPITSTMTLEQLRGYILEEYGRAGLERLPARLERVERTGTSGLDGGTLESLLVCNRAGENEANATLEEIIKRYAPIPVVGPDGEKIGETYDCGEPGCCRPVPNGCEGSR